MDTGKSALGLDGNLAAAIGYPISILAIVCLVMEKENRFVKFSCAAIDPSSCSYDHRCDLAWEYSS